MRPDAERTLRRFLEQDERPPRRRRAGRISSAPIVLGLGLLLGYQLLVRLVPWVWSATLPGGLAQARGFRGGPGLVYHLAVACYQNVATATGLIIGAVLVAFLLGALARPLRWLVWLAAVAVILIDASILAVTLQAALWATARASGMPI